MKRKEYYVWFPGFMVVAIICGISFWPQRNHSAKAPVDRKTPPEYPERVTVAPLPPLTATTMPTAAQITVNG